MVSKQVVQVIIEAEEQVSKAAKKAEEALKKMGNAGSKGLNKLTSISSKVQSAFSKLHSYVDRAREKFNQFANSSNKIGMIKSAISNAANSFGNLVKNSDLAAKAMEKLKSVSDGIQSKFTSLQSKIRGFGSSVKSSLKSAFSLTGIKEKFSSIGSSIDSLKTKMRSLAQEAKKTGGSGGLGFLKNAASMTVGMLGYDLVNSMMESARASLNARSSMQAFAGRLKMSGTEVDSFQQSLDNLQSTYKKIDMDVVGQQATDMAFRLGLPKTALSELTETTAIFTDAMQRNGRSAEDSMLAMSDAMDGQFVRLKEIGIGQEDLMRNGWSGDINDKTGLLKAMNKALKEQHYDELAKSVDTLDDAWKVLSVTMGNLLESILVPLTPVIVGIVSALTDAVSGIMGFVNSLKNAFSGLPEWAQIGIAIAAVAIGVGIAIAAFGGLEAILLSLASAIAPVVMAITAISWPIVAVVAAVGLLIAAIYEVGKAFGWWSDVGTMLEAIGVGLQRMWDAFINHPDVQATISAITGALEWLTGAIGNAWNAILQFFGVSTGSDWDVTRAIIDAIGIAWQGLTAHIRLAIQIIQAVWGALQYLYNGFVSLGSFLTDVFTPVWQALTDMWSSIMEIVQPVVDLFTQFQQGQASLGDVAMGAVTAIWNIWLLFSSNIGNLLVGLASNMLTWAISAGMNFLNGISTYLSQLAGRVSTYLLATRARIIAQLTAWVAQGRAKASQFVNAIINFFRTLPGKALSALMAVVHSIVSAGTAWINNARNKATSVVTGVVGILQGLPGKISSAISGVVSAITAPFQKAYDTLTGIVDKIKSKASEVANIAFGGETFAMGGETALDIGETNFNVGETGNSTPTEININHNIILDLVNVPAHIETGVLIEMLKDPAVLNSFVSNPDFQSLDAKVKSTIQSRYNRSRGV